MFSVRSHLPVDLSGAGVTYSSKQPIINIKIKYSSNSVFTWPPYLCTLLGGDS